MTANMDALTLPGTKRSPGRPTIRTRELARAICGAISSGKSLRRILSLPGMPSYAAVCVWLREDREFQEQYTRAREAQADYVAPYVMTEERRAILIAKKRAAIEWHRAAKPGASRKSGRAALCGKVAETHPKGLPFTGAPKRKRTSANTNEIGGRVLSYVLTMAYSRPSMERKPLWLFDWWPRRESNPDLEFRKPLFYPLNYGAG